MHRFLSGVLAIALILAASPALACHSNGLCSFGSFLSSTGTEPCDVVCDGPTCTYSHSMNQCDTCGGPGPDYNVPDGLCIICNHAGRASTIKGAGIDEIICGEDLDDTIEGRGGDDIVMGGTGDDVLDGGSGADELYGGTGEDVYDGGNGDDTILDAAGNSFVTSGDGDDLIWTGAGDDEIDAGKGDDAVISGPGGDFVIGGDGNDSLSSVLFTVSSIPDDALGATYCGGDGNDNIQARGAGHQCMDGGADTDTCSYLFFVTTRTAAAQDIGTGMSNCETETGTDSREPFCGCP